MSRMIRVSEETYAHLGLQGRMGETFDAVLKRLLRIHSLQGSVASKPAGRRTKHESKRKTDAKHPKS